MTELLSACWANRSCGKKESADGEGPGLQCLPTNRVFAWDGDTLLQEVTVFPLLFPGWDWNKDKVSAANYKSWPCSGQFIKFHWIKGQRGSSEGSSMSPGHPVSHQKSEGELSMVQRLKWIGLQDLVPRRAQRGVNGDQRGGQEHGRHHIQWNKMKNKIAQEIKFNTCTRKAYKESSKWSFQKFDQSQSCNSHLKISVRSYKDSYKWQGLNSVIYINKNYNYYKHSKLEIHLKKLWYICITQPLIIHLNLFNHHK